MALDFIRQNPINDFVDGTPRPGKMVCLRKKTSKGKFSVLLGGNLLVWVFFIVSLLDMQVFSMGKIPLDFPFKLAVNGIVYHETSPSVIIAKEVYGLGDVVDGYTIVDINRTEVRLSKGDKTIVRQVR